MEMGRVCDSRLTPAGGGIWPGGLGIFASIVGGFAIFGGVVADSSVFTGSSSPKSKSTALKSDKPENSSAPLKSRIKPSTAFGLNFLTAINSDLNVVSEGKDSLYSL